MTEFMPMDSIWPVLSCIAWLGKYDGVHYEHYGANHSNMHLMSERIATMRFKSMLSIVFMMAVALTIGCQDNKIAQDATDATAEGFYRDPLTVLSDADRSRGQEVQLIEQMARYRQAYEEHLQILVRFYDHQGNQQKVTWAQEELAHLKKSPRRAYLAVAETAGPQLRASRSDANANIAYAEAVALFEEGKGTLGGKFLMKKDKLWLAVEKLEELITRYPDSDKIDDAAFVIGKIYQKSMDDNTLALLYYQRVLQWDPQTKLPVRFAIAQTYDHGLHDRVNAVKFYESAINFESEYTGNVIQSHNRIQSISKEFGPK